MKEMERKSYFRYWGKAEKDGVGYHLLPYHCLDVAAGCFKLMLPGGNPPGYPHALWGAFWNHTA